MGREHSGGQAEELMRGISSTLPAVLAKLEAVLEQQVELRRDVGELRERVAALESAEEVRDQWNGEERRKVGERLGSGDQTFGLLRQQIADAQGVADRAYNVAKDALDAIDAATANLPKREATGVRKKWFFRILEAAIPHLLPIVLSLLASTFTYLALLAKLAEKAVGGHP